jgi:[acyl-carrier-protein] S-malonyltransferase
MGLELLVDPDLFALCKECGDAAGVDLTRLLTEADEDELRLTENAQPALCFTSIALARVLGRGGVHPVAVAGHSVGEYAALAVAGSMSAADAVAAVRHRGLVMADAVPAGTTSMAAVLGLDPPTVEAVLEGVSDVWPANYNTPTQTVIGGRIEALEIAEDLLKRSGARKVIRLNVSAAFHTPLMVSAAANLKTYLDGMNWSAPQVPVIANLTARPYEGVVDLTATLEKQLFSPVRWANSVRMMGELGCDGFLELGPRRALTGMMRELAPNAFAAAIATPEGCIELEMSAK